MFEIPKFGYFKSGNIFTGSEGLLNYRLMPMSNKIVASFWLGENCYSCTNSDVIKEREFDLSEYGVSMALEWIKNRGA